MQINISHAIIIKQKKIYKTQFMLTTRKITNLTLTYLVKGSRTKEMKQATWIKYLKVVLLMYAILKDLIRCQILYCLDIEKTPFSYINFLF